MDTVAIVVDRETAMYMRLALSLVRMDHPESYIVDEIDPVRRALGDVCYDDCWYTEFEGCDGHNCYVVVQEECEE